MYSVQSNFFLAILGQWETSSHAVDILKVITVFFPLHVQILLTILGEVNVMSPVHGANSTRSDNALGVQGARMNMIIDQVCKYHNS